MKLSFVIPAYNEEAYIGKCLSSINEEMRGKNYEIEIIVVNNASTDKTKEVALAYPGVKVVDEPIKGLSQARQAGFLAASGDLIANIDADTILTPNWIDKVFKFFGDNSDVVAYSGPHILYDLSPVVNFWVRMFYYAGYINYLIMRHILRRSSMLQGGNYIFRRDAFAKIGGFNPKFTFFGEDTDVARRLHKVGRVEFSFDLPIYASGRRLKGEGVINTAVKYIINYFWTIWFKKPFHKKFTDIRP